MIRDILMASTCAAALVFGSAAGAVTLLDGAKGPLTGQEPQAAFQLVESEGNEAGASGSTTGDTTEEQQPVTGDVTGDESAVGATEGQPATGDVTSESAVGATEGEPATGDATGDESAVEAAEEGTGGTHCEQSTVATSQQADVAPDATC
jgi:hypothetical protein